MCCCLKVPIKRDVEAAVNQTKVLSVKRQSYCVLAHRPPTLTNTANPTCLPSNPLHPPPGGSASQAAQAAPILKPSPPAR